MQSIGSVPYLNAKPLLEGLEQSTQSQLLLAPPSQLHQKIIARQVDIALLPVISFLEAPELKLIPGTGISCRGPVRSVKVFYENSEINLSNTRSIYLDPHSKTSQKLLKVILLKKYDRDPNEIEWVDSQDKAETYLMIGDEALKRSHYEFTTDLGQEWFDLTGLPFVFACWMSQNRLSKDFIAELHNAKFNGQQALPKIASDQKLVEPDEALSYLTRNIRYNIQAAELVGLKMFFDWVAEMEQQSYDTSLRFVS